MDRQWIEELLQKVDLPALISRYVHLTKKGQTYWGCCPFHHEKDPSFTVTPDKGFYYCFGCKESGNAITFLSKMESIDRIDAIRILAKETGFELPEYKKQNESSFVLDKKKDRLRILMKEAARHYHENLSLPAAKIARDYIEKRQIESMVKRFGLGYSVDGHDIIDFLVSKGFTKSEIKEAGIAEQSADRYYDVFNKRLIIPIINAFGDVVAFGGRILEDAKFAKYRNSCQTLLFDKSKTIFAINLLKKKKQAEGLPYIIITEGYMDVISLHKAGITEAVASMGTSLTIEQAKLLKNYNANIYISYDGDSAGQKAALRGLDILKSVGLNVKVISLPEGKDPDDVIKEKGKEGYIALLDQAVSLTEFKILSQKKNFDLSKPEGKSGFAIEAIKIIKQLESPVEQEEYIRKLHEITGYSMETLYKQAELTVNESFSPPPPPIKNADVTNPIIKAQEFLVASVLAAKPFATHYEDLQPYLSENFLRNVYTDAIGLINAGKSLSSLFTLYENDSSELIKLLDYNFMEGDGAEKFEECLNLLKTDLLSKQKNQLVKEYEETKDIGIVAKIRLIDAKLKQMKKSGGHNG